MSELFFIIKSLVLTFLITAIMQVKVDNITLEQKTQWFVQRSPASIYMQTVAAGGALALRELYTSVKSGLTGKAESYRRDVGIHAGK